MRRPWMACASGMADVFHHHASWTIPHSSPTHNMNFHSHNRILPTLSEFGCKMKTAEPVGFKMRMHSGTATRIIANHSSSVHFPYERSMQGYGGSVITASTLAVGSVGRRRVQSPSRMRVPLME